MASAIDPALVGITLEEPPPRDPRLCRGVQSGTYDEQMRHADLQWRMKVIHQLSKPCVYHDIMPVTRWCGEYVDWLIKSVHCGVNHDC